MFPGITHSKFKTSVIERMIRRDDLIRMQSNRIIVTILLTRVHLLHLKLIKSVFLIVDCNELLSLFGSLPCNFLLLLAPLVIFSFFLGNFSLLVKLDYTNQSDESYNSYNSSYSPCSRCLSKGCRIASLGVRIRRLSCYRIPKPAYIWQHGQC